MGEACPTGRTTSHPVHKIEKNWCSNANDNKGFDVPRVVQYLVCPNENACGGEGDKILMPELDGTRLRREIDTYDKTYKFVRDDVCAWMVKNPPGMKARDWMWLEITQVQFAQVYVARMYDYDYRGRQPSHVGLGKKYGMLAGKDFYVVAISDSVFPGTARLDMWVHRAPS